MKVKNKHTTKYYSWSPNHFKSDKFRAEKILKGNQNTSLRIMLPHPALQGNFLILVVS